MFLEELEMLRSALTQNRPVSWEDLPDIELYMDQLLTYMQRQQVISRPEDALTSSMVNNYIKDGLIDKPRSKRYSRDHLANLTAICILKQVLSVKDVSFLLNQETRDREISLFYKKYNEILDESMNRISEDLTDISDAKALSDTALRLAVHSYTAKLTCEYLLEILKAGIFDNADNNDKQIPEEK